MSAGKTPIRNEPESSALASAYNTSALFRHSVVPGARSWLVRGRSRAARSARIGDMRSVVRPLVSVTTYRRWTFLLGGTALLVPYILIYAGLVQIMGNLRVQSTRALFDGLVML